MEHYIERLTTPIFCLPTKASSQFTFRGTLDLAIVDVDYARLGYIAGGLLVGIELQKSLKLNHEMQAIIELILAKNIPSEHPVMLLLTNLGGIWHYYWLQKGTIAYNEFDLRHLPLY